MITHTPNEGWFFAYTQKVGDDWEDHYHVGTEKFARDMLVSAQTRMDNIVCAGIGRIEDASDAQWIAPKDVKIWTVISENDGRFESSVHYSEVDAENAADRMVWAEWTLAFGGDYPDDWEDALVDLENEGSSLQVRINAHAVDFSKLVAS